MDILQLIFLSYIIRAMCIRVSHIVAMLIETVYVFMRKQIYRVLKPARLKHNCNKWANICQVVNCPRRSKYYNWWRLLGFSYTTYEHTCVSDYCFPSCGWYRCYWSIDTIGEGLKWLKGVLKTEIKKEFKAKVKHNCRAMYAYCKRDGCCREKWWYPVATWLFLQYKPPPHDCQGEYACSLFTCPESEWSSYFLEYWENYFKMTIYEFKHGFLDMPKLEGEEETSTTKPWHEGQHNYVNEPIIGEPIFDGPVFDDPVDTNYEFSDSDTETEASINLDYSPNYLPKLKGFVGKSHNTYMLLIYSFESRLLAFRCRHHSTNVTYVRVFRGPNLYCLCHKHRQYGAKHNMDKVATRGKTLVEVVGRNSWKDNYIIYNQSVPTLKNLSIANIWCHDIQQLMFKQYEIPRDIAKTLLYPIYKCLRLNCGKENYDVCTEWCPMKVECNFKDNYDME
jgi:hypothetical protein